MELWLSSPGSSFQGSLVTQRNSLSSSGMNRTKHCSSSSQAMSNKCKIPAHSVTEYAEWDRTHKDCPPRAGPAQDPPQESHLVPKNAVQMELELCHSHHKATLCLSPGSDRPRKQNNFYSCSSEQQHQGNAEGGFKTSWDLTKQKYAKKYGRTISASLLQAICFVSLNNITCDSV